MFKRVLNKIKLLFKRENEQKPIEKQWYDEVLVKKDSMGSLKAVYEDREEYIHHSVEELSKTMTREEFFKNYGRMIEVAGCLMVYSKDRPERTNILCPLEYNHSQDVCSLDKLVGVKCCTEDCNKCWGIIINKIPFKGDK